MPADSLAEAILRELGAFGKDVGRQIGTNEEINRQRNFENQSRQFDFDVEQGRQADITARSDRDFGLRQQKYDLDLATRNPVSKRILDAIAGAQQPPPMKDQLSNMFATDRPAYYEHERIMEDIKNPKDGATAKARTATPKQRDKATQEIFEEQRQGWLDRSGYPSLLELQDASAQGLGQTKSVSKWYNPGTWGDEAPDPDLTAHNTLEAYNRIGGPAHAQAFHQGDSLPMYRPELGGGQLPVAPQPVAQQPVAQEQPPMPAGWPGTQEQWLDYLRRKAAQE